MIDYIAISGKIENRILEYVNHLHEHFVDPVVIKNGNYLLPKEAGYSITMKKKSLEEYSFPHGAIWKTESEDKLKTSIIS